MRLCHVTGNGSELRGATVRVKGSNLYTELGAMAARFRFIWL
jgi:hypothetical protein